MTAQRTEPNRRAEQDEYNRRSCRCALCGRLMRPRQGDVV